MLFHTLLLSAYSLKPLGIELARRGFVVIIPDLPGHGYSEGELPIFFNASDLGILVASAVTYIKDFFDLIVGYAKKEVNPSGPSNVKLIFIGHSFGGGIALLYAALRKDVCATIIVSFSVSTYALSWFSSSKWETTPTHLIPLNAPNFSNGT